MLFIGFSDFEETKIHEILDSSLREGENRRREGEKVRVREREREKAESAGKG